MGYIPEDVVKKIEEDFLKCKKDPCHFIANHIKVENTVLGLVKFKLFKFQRRIINDIHNNRFTILKKFRQAGCTTLLAAYALWRAIFLPPQNILILSIGDRESTEVLERIKLMYENLPPHVRPVLKSDNAHSMRFTNRSRIRSLPSSKQSGRSFTSTFLVIDEAAFIENLERLWRAAYPVVSTGGKVSVLSTVNGIGNWFYDNWHKASEGLSDFIPIQISWQEYPLYKYDPDPDLIDLYKELDEKGYDYKNWEKTTRKNTDIKSWLQEYEGEFLGTGDTFIDGSILKQLFDGINEDYDNKYNNRMRVWKDPDPNHEYILCADTSLGRGRDHSAFHILDIYTGEQVAEFYSSRTTVDEFAKIVQTEAIYYNTALTIGERNQIGSNLLDKLFNELEYENLWFDEKGRIGFEVGQKTRLILLGDLEEVLRNSLIRVNSRRTIDELFTFIFKESAVGKVKIEAEEGKYDDLVMSLCLGARAFKDYRQNSPIYLAHNKEPYNTPPDIQVVKRTESLSWLKD